jgi:signal transduction histidine kinase
MSEAISLSRAVDVVRRRDFWVVVILFGCCCLLYYFGELVDYAGWSALKQDFFYGVHDVHRALFIIPIAYAAHQFRIKGSLIVALAAFVVFLPRALFISEYSDPLLRPVLFTIIAGVFGTFVGVIRNEAERRSRLEALVRTERDRFLGILERMEEAVYIVGPDYKIRYTNPSMVREFGQGNGGTCYEFLCGFDEPCGAICRLPAIIAGGIERWEYNFPDGKTYEVTGSPFVDSDGETCQLAVFRDITQRKQVELELIELDNLKTELLSNVSHELRSPLASIKGIISSLLQKDISLDTETSDMLLKGVSEETDRLASLVTKLLDMSKLEAGVWNPEKRLCEISDIVDEAFERQRWIHKNHVFEIEMEPDLPEFHADCNQVRQVIVNLVENAAAYSKEGTKITVKAKAVDGNELEISVSDEGVGIPQEDLERIFDKFFRGSQDRRNPGGTGLGLAICQAIVQNHGGRIWAESEIGRGSTFRFTLPAARNGKQGR